MSRAIAHFPIKFQVIPPPIADVVGLTSVKAIIKGNRIFVPSCRFGFELDRTSNCPAVAFFALTS